MQSIRIASVSTILAPNVFCVDVDDGELSAL